MKRRSIFLLIAFLPATALSDESRPIGPPSGNGGPDLIGTHIEKRAAKPEEEVLLDPALIREWILGPFRLPAERGEPNALHHYVAGRTYPRALEAVATYLATKEAKRHWKRLASKTLKDRYETDSSYSDLDLFRDKERLRAAWHGRKLDKHTWQLAPGAQEVSRPEKEYNIIENRFFTLDKDLRLRFALDEVMGVVIGDGPEDDFSYQPVRSDAGFSRLPARRSRMPRIQLRARGRLRLDRKTLLKTGDWTNLECKYGVALSLDLLSRPRSQKILTAFLDVDHGQETGMEISFGIRRRF
ncbi:MAG: hypothetical protein O7H41_06560 [Planctomycetota bacterium]|nr:hypothetical protein [Planctomycetota bacterium]